jgi:hypothetical protein
MSRISTRYPVSGAPPVLDGAVQFTTTCPSPFETPEMDGAPGGDAGVTVAALDEGPVASALLAVTLTE